MIGIFERIVTDARVNELEARVKELEEESRRLSTLVLGFVKVFAELKLGLVKEGDD